MSRNSRWSALLVLCAGQLMVILDGTIVNVALPSIQSDLGFGPTSLAWVMNAYLIGFGGLLPLAGRFGDLLGRKRVFVAGLVAFVAASALCGVADSQAALIVGRFLQGAGGALASAVVLGMIVTLFDAPRDRAKAIGAFTFVGAGGASLGTVAGAMLTQAVGWHWIFFVNVPIGLVAAALATRTLTTERGLGLRAGADAVGALLVTAGLMLGVYTIVRAADESWTRTLGTGVVAIGLLAAFVVRQATARTPLLPLRVFRSRLVSGANLVELLMVAGMFGFQFLITLYLRQVLGYGVGTTGLAMLPTAVTIGAVSLGLSARLNTRYGVRRVLRVGLVLIVVGLGILTTIPPTDGYPRVLLAMVVMGTGFASAMPALTTLAMSGATTEDSGVASGLFNTTQQIGGALGLAVLATVATAHTRHLLPTGVPGPEAQTAGYRLAFGVAAAVVLAALVLATTLLRRTAPDRPAPISPDAPKILSPAERRVT